MCVVFAGCRKSLIELSDTTRQQQVSDAFYVVPKDAHPSVAALADGLKRRLWPNIDLKVFEQQHGKPVWNKAVVQVAQSAIAASGMEGSSNTSNGDGDQALMIIPFQHAQNGDVLSFLSAAAHGNSLYTLRLYNRDSMNHIAPGSAQEALHLASTQALFGYFEKQVNGIDSIAILAPLPGKIANIRFKPGIENDDLNPVAGSASSSSSTTTGNCHEVVTGWELGFDVISFWGQGNLQRVWEIPAIHLITVTVCDHINFDSGGPLLYSDNNFWNGTDATSGTTGSGEGGGMLPGEEFYNGTGLTGTEGSTAEDGKPIDWIEPFDATDTRQLNIDLLQDENGYYFSRIGAINDLLNKNPYALIPCDQLERIGHYGIVFQKLATFVPDQSIRDRISEIKSLAPNWIVDNFNLQSLDGADGSAVNCDFFPIKIEKLPTGFNKDELLEYFRKNINSFISPSIDVTFTPYKDGNFDDVDRFNAPFELSKGALISIDMLNDGSVILSDYKHDAGWSYFNFSTMETPLDFEHPVAGTRQFGIYEAPSNPQQLVFYISGVDRIWDWYTALLNKVSFDYGFKSADNLWKNVIENFSYFIQSKGGIATAIPDSGAALRINYDKVEEYLKGKISFNDLKTALGC